MKKAVLNSPRIQGYLATQGVLLLFFLSGFAALLYQVIWQRLLGIFSGVDIFSVTVIVAAFMAGMGLGNLAGGHLADRLSSRWRIGLFALSEGAIAGFALISRWLYYDVLYQRWSHIADSPTILALVLFLSLLWPTFFMGMTLPLLSKALTRSVQGAAGVVGSLYGVNTLGAAAGAFVTGWFLMRLQGFDATLRLGLFLNVASALGALFIAAFLLPKETSSEGEASGTNSEELPGVQEGTLSFRAWLLLYALSGFTALTLEMLWFRAMGVMQKPTAFTFSNLLAMYLGGLALGTFAGIVLERRARRPQNIFLLVQAGVVLFAGSSFAILVCELGRWPFLTYLTQYFAEYSPMDLRPALNALANGLFFLDFPAMLDSPQMYRFIIFYFVLPAVFILPPTFLMGLSFPFLQKAVQNDAALLGRRVGWLQTANIAGSTLGAILASAFFLHFLGTAATLRFLVVLGTVFLVLLVRVRRMQRRSTALSIILILAPICVAIFVPSSEDLWAGLHGSEPGFITFSEDGTGLSLAKASTPDFTGRTDVFINGRGQSWWPFGGVHTWMGVLPLLLHPNPESIACIGMGSGDTVFALGGREETRAIVCIEIVRSLLPVMKGYLEQTSYGGCSSLLTDPRICFHTGDGRAFLARNDTLYDIIEIDALFPESPCAGNLYSAEFFSMLKNRLRPGGYVVAWLPTQRVRDTFGSVFPFLVSVKSITVGSASSIPIDKKTMQTQLASPFTSEYYARAGLDAADFAIILDEIREVTAQARTDLNSDLFPRDEFMAPDMPMLPAPRRKVGALNAEKTK